MDRVGHEADPRDSRPGGARRRADVRPAVRRRSRTSRARPGYRVEVAAQLPHPELNAFVKKCVRVRIAAHRSAVDAHEVRAVAGRMAGAARRCAPGRRRGGSAAAASRAVADRRTPAAGAAQPRRAPTALSPRSVRGSARAGSVRACGRTSASRCPRRGPSLPRWRASSRVRACTAFCSPDGTRACSARFTRCSSAPAVSCSTMRCGRRSIRPPAIWAAGMIADLHHHRRVTPRDLPAWHYDEISAAFRAGGRRDGVRLAGQLSPL